VISVKINNMKGLFNVDDYNDWFNDKGKKTESYANPGIFLRLDKLSDDLIFDYFRECRVDDVENLMYGQYKEEFNKFRTDIRADWRDKLDKKE